MEEAKKDTNQVLLNFELAISTKPNVVKYNITGNVSLEGKPDDIKKRLEVNPKTKIPQLLFTIYQHVFSSIYMLSSNLNTPYPPPDLLHPMAEKIQIILPTAQAEPAKEKTEAPQAPPAAAPTPAQEKTAAPPTPASTPTQNSGAAPSATPPPAEKKPEAPAAPAQEKPVTPPPQEKTEAPAEATPPTEEKPAQEPSAQAQPTAAEEAPK